MLSTVNGCDSLVITSLFHLPTYSVVLNDTVCDNQSYTLPNGTVVNAAGTYPVMLSTINGCDSLVTTNLFHLPTYNVVVNDTVCDNQPFTLPNGTVVNAAGTYPVMLSTINGCDSLVTTNLFHLPTYNVVVNDTVCDNQPFTLPNGTVVNAAGTYPVTLSTINGCDSLVTTNLFHLPTYNVVVNDTVCDNQPFTLPNGTVVNAAGTYPVTLSTINGCDSLVTTNLFHLPTYSVVLNDTVCDNQSYTLPNGTVVNAAGTYPVMLSTINGCDSLVTTNLFHAPTYNTYINPTICEGASYPSPLGVALTVSGVYVFNLSSVVGCDSIVTIDLDVRPTTYTTATDTICLGEVYTLPTGQQVSLQGNYTLNLSSQFGCDSIVQFLLITRPLPQAAISASTVLCPGDTLFLLVNGLGTYNWSGPASFSSNVANPFIYPALPNNSGLYTVTVTDIHGCSASSTVSVSIPIPVVNTINASICSNELYTLPGGLQVGPGSYWVTIPGSSGCDSLYNFVVLGFTAYEIYDTLTICEDETVFLGGAWTNTPGDYIDGNFSIDGCDSIVYTHLQVQYNPVFSVTGGEMCYGDLVQIQASTLGTFNWSPNQTLSCNQCAEPEARPEQTTVYTAWITGCNGEIIQDTAIVVVHDIPQVFAGSNSSVVLGDTITVNGQSTDPVTFSWSYAGSTLCDDCPSYTITPEESLTLTLTGVDDFGCVNTDDVTITVNTACKYSNIEVPNMISPNGDGYNDELAIRFEGVAQVTLIRVFNRWGELIFESTDPSQAWDGSFRGQTVNPGVYTYYVQGLCLDLKDFIYTGNVTVLK
jgi:gliding motility-associated-like protein